MTRPLATFTPSLVDPATLERLFVAREPLLADLVERAREALSSRTRAHRLMVGPRGAGKTHLLTLARHRIAALTPAPPIAWLPEDPWLIDGYADLLRAVSVALDAARGIASSTMPAHVSADALEATLRAHAAEHGPIVVLAENVDRIFDTLGIDGQRRLRRFMENDRALLLLVTATRLGAELLDQDGPFYGFFSTVELAPFDTAQAAEMLARIAEHRGNDALAERLRSSPATDRYRLAAIDALAGGQPRVWALLGSALSVDGLDALSDILVTRFDDLTPYYQEQLGRLAPQERKLVRTLADQDRAASVGDMAETLGVSPRSLAKTVSTLRRAGWIAEVPIPGGVGDARKTYFELAEPLARLAFQLKDNRGEPIPLLVAFLSAWFSRDELETTDETLSAFARSHLAAACADEAVRALIEAFGMFRRSTVPDPLLLALSDALAALANGDPEPYLRLPSTTRRVAHEAVDERGIGGARRLCIELGSRDAHWIEHAERLVSDSGEFEDRQRLAELYFRNDRRDEASVLGAALVAERAQVFGPEHPKTLKMRLTELVMSGDFWTDEGVSTLSALRALLSDCVRIVGADDALTLDVRWWIGLATWSVDEDVASSSLRSLLDDEIRVLGADGTDLYAKFSILIAIQIGAERFEDASLVAERMVEFARAEHGVDDEATLMSRLTHARTVRLAHGREHARSLLLELLEDCRRVLGGSHRRTIEVEQALEQLDGFDGGASSPHEVQIDSRESA